MYKYLLSSLLLYSTVSFAQQIELKSGVWSMKSNSLSTDINTTSLDDKDVKALWQYKASEWFFYSSDSSLHSL